MDNPITTFLLSTLALIVVLAFVALGLWGCPQYGVYSARLRGQAELAQAQGNRLALVATAGAQDEAAKAFAEATSRRMAGWVQAAKAGCAELGRTDDHSCQETLIKQAALYSMAKEGHEGVNLVVGAGGQPAVAVSGAPNAGKE